MAVTIHTIQINYNGGVITYTPPSPLKVFPGEKLCWEANEDFSVAFCADQSPYKCKKRSLAGEKGAGNGTGPLLIRELKQAEKPRKTFKYCVAVHDPATKKLVTKDPEIIVEDLGGGEGPEPKKAAQAQPKKKAAMKTR